MDVCFLLVLSIFIQLSFGYLLKLMFPTLVGLVYFNIIQIAVLSVISVFLPAYLYQKNENRSYFTDCFKGIKFDFTVILCVLIGICSQYVGIAANMPVNILLKFFNKAIESNIPPITTTGLFFIGIVVLCILPAVFEEVLFRGIIFNKVRAYGVNSAIIISSLLFALMHLDFSNFLGTFVLGIVCGIVIKYTNRIFYTMIIHFMLNFTSLLITFLSKNDMIKNLYGDYFIVFLVISVPLLIYLMRLFKQNAKKFDYKDKEKYESVNEEIIKINEENSIRIIEHDIRENNISLAFKKLFSSIYFYILIIMFIYVGGASL